MDTICPGQNTLFWKPEDIFETPCPVCDYPVEFFKDDVSRKCPKCGFTLTQPKPPEQCPECKETCEFKNVTCYLPECGGVGNMDPRL